MTVSAETLLDMFRTVSRINACDERLRGLLNTGRIFIFYYSPRGQEIIPAAVSASLRSDDYIVTTYRGIHDEIAKGAPLPELMAEILGRTGRDVQGKGGPMHISDPTSGVMVTTGVVGGGLPIANGLALASKLRGDDRVTVANFGDGAANIGAFHEAAQPGRGVGAAGRVRVPEQPIRRVHPDPRGRSGIEQVADRAAGYGMPGVTVDGNDPLGHVRRRRRGDRPGPSR